ncbi:VanZ family protein [Butyrivibrio sp. MC2013]|uniref:VanZ family protein n=1 Tax=Butyrivibrio sp. MC2013 TaxID=1280686 RepID=UPI0018C9FA75|nr:VanZ family protein [Butyrivibrio sp. MC2013]
MRKLRKFIFYFSIFLLFLGILIIIYLTRQTREQTLWLSNAGARAFSEFFPWHENQYWVMLKLNNPRKLIHVYQGFAFGVIVETLVLTAPGKKVRIFLRSYLAVLICFYISFLDQLHKRFVPGREFDFADIIRDAMGYFVSITIVLIIALIIKGIYKLCSIIFLRRSVEE